MIAFLLKILWFKFLYKILSYIRRIGIVNSFKEYYTGKLFKNVFL